MNDDRKTSANRKSLARLMAVQKIYSNEISGDSSIDDETRLPDDLMKELGFENQKPDKKFLSRIIDEFSTNRENIDSVLKSHLSGNWTIDKMDIVLKSILRAGICEINYIKDTPRKVIINEYMKIAESFFDTEGFKEKKFVNAVLDKIAKSGA